ncbi:DUF4298 domain-containing protein [Facklamia sp. 7083-14-GEN3]|uniref:DUF4298 domain-containing protein n=1 Tax=Facklamia sp. 7083-14-GEN3 TaxID=2973478 RepID=UPI00215CE206|nr:DUF4298 domain-containing protein [Facklamia sp. 7083-14-GEN3]MCR8969352.1 DUF4298 domain-containing protein [Facklamia sp. 7083-14-GEN3]
MDKIDHFIEMEENYLAVDQAVNDLMHQLEAFQSQKEKVKKLIEYYGSQQWYDHQELDNMGLLPKTSTRAVLGQDYAYDTLNNLKECAIQMLEISTDILKIY